MTDRLAFNRQDLALFLTASIRQAGNERAFLPFGAHLPDLGRAEGERREELRLRKQARVSAPVMASALSGDGPLTAETQAALWLALGINPDIRRDSRELQTFGAAKRRACGEEKVAA